MRFPTLSKVLTGLVAICFCVSLVSAQDAPPPPPPSSAPSAPSFSPDQMDNLMAPIALYPDPLLAQILPASTYPDQVDEAARDLRGGMSSDSIDSEPWDVSVKSLAHYPTVLYMMADKLDWTTSLGQAYVSQPGDVMSSVQRLRAQARSVGNLVSTPQEQVVDQGGNIEIWPAQPQYIYVPEYDPDYIYFRHGGFFGGDVLSFGVGFAIGAWLDFDCDWGGRRISYYGWGRGGPGWAQRSRPYVNVHNNVYINNSYRRVPVDRAVVNRSVAPASLNRYNSIHRNVTFNNVHTTNVAAETNRGTEARPAATNKMISRNINTSDSNIAFNRGHATPQAAASQPRVNATVSANRTTTTTTRSIPQTPSRSSERSETSAFTPAHSSYSPAEASQRGQASRMEASHSSAPAPSRPAPQRSAPPPSHQSQGGGSHQNGGKK